MELIIDFYKNLDTINLIIFWGIIIVIMLLLIFSFIMINKNKKLKKLVEQNNQEERYIPIIKEEVEKEITTEKISDEKKIQENGSTIEEKNTNDKFIERNDYSIESSNEDEIKEKNIKNEDVESSPKTYEKKQPIEMPTGPYQRNVLREMSLSQTSPIGINRRVEKEEKKLEIAKDLEESLNNENKEVNSLIQDKTKDELNNQYNETNYELPKKNIKTIENISYELKKEINTSSNTNLKYNNQNENTQAKELLNNISKIQESRSNKNSSEIYLEEVSRKLAEAEISDEIERTDYELEQEENAIISYKELMEKKDSIQTIDEEDAVISIEELMNRSNKKEEIKLYEESKLYNLTENEKNDEFIKELKQFRNDL